MSNIGWRFLHQSHFWKILGCLLWCFYSMSIPVTWCRSQSFLRRNGAVPDRIFDPCQYRSSISFSPSIRNVSDRFVMAIIFTGVSKFCLWLQNFKYRRAELHNFFFISCLPPRNQIKFPFTPPKSDWTLNSKIWGVRSVMVIVVGNGHGDTSSNPRRD